MHPNQITKELAHVLSTPWSIHPDYMDALFSNLPKIIESVGADLSFMIAEDPPELKNVRYVDDVAVLSITGPVVKRDGWWLRWWGYFSTDAIKETIRELVESSSVSSIILDLDCPGGQVSGTADLSDFIFQSRGIKPIIAVSNELMTSAAYWFGSACDEIVINQTGVTGSIGVYTLHQDWSQWEKDLGVKTTIFKAGRYKAVWHPSRPVDDLAREVYQTDIDQIYMQFVNAVARNRNMTPEAVHSEIGDARCFRGEEAVKVGAADRVATLDQVIQELSGSSDDSPTFQGGNYHAETNGPESTGVCEQFARHIERNPD